MARPNRKEISTALQKVMEKADRDPKVRVYWMQTRPTSPSRAYCEKCKPLHLIGHCGSDDLTEKDLTSAFDLETMCNHLAAWTLRGVSPPPEV